MQHPAIVGVESPLEAAPPSQELATFKVGRVVAVTGSTVTGVLRTANETADSPISISKAVQIGALIKIRTPESHAFGVVTALRFGNTSSSPDEAERFVDIELLCEAMDEPNDPSGPRFQRGVSVYPSLDADIVATTRDELGLVYAPPKSSNVRIGSIHQDRTLPAFLMTDELLGKHFAVLGTTGSGKSCSVALILHSILKQHRNGRIVLLDPHSEYAQAFEGMSEVIDPSNLNLPYWLLNFEETAAVLISGDGSERDAAVMILKAAILEAKRACNEAAGDTGHITVDTPVPYRLSDLLKSIDDAMGQLDKPDSSAPYLRLKARLETIRADRRFGFMFSRFMVADTMADVLSRIQRIPVAGKPITIVDLSGVPAEIVDAVVSVLCRMIFDFALWSARPKSSPLLLVCEEAHRYVPRANDIGFGPTKDAIGRIAKEGRKYGVSLCLVTQRPSELSTSILSQCNTLIAMRMSNERDKEYVQGALPDGAFGLFNVLPSLKNQEAVVVGEGVTVPMRFRFDDLAEHERPRSGSASFSTAWQDDLEHESFIDETIDRWRRQIRQPATPDYPEEILDCPEEILDE